MRWWSGHNIGKEAFACCLSFHLSHSLQCIFVNKHFSIKFSFQKLCTVFWDWLRTVLVLWILLRRFYCYIWWFPFLCVVATLSSLFFLLLCAVSYLNGCEVPADSVLPDLFMFFSNFTSFWLGVGWIIALMNVFLLMTSEFSTTFSSLSCTFWFYFATAAPQSITIPKQCDPIIISNIQLQYKNCSRWNAKQLCCIRRKNCWPLSFV